MELLAEGGDDEEGSIPPGAHQIAVTQEESDAIDRVSLIIAGRNYGVANVLSSFAA